MSSPLMTDEEVEMADKENTVTSKRSLEEQMKESLKNEDSIIKEDLIEETEKELKNDIPSNYIEVNLVSNGRIEGIPSKLHFRCYSASDALDLNVDDDNKVKAITKVLTRLNYENFDVGKLPIQDVLFILYRLHGSFISKKIVKKVYIDDTIEDEKLLNADENLEEVDIPITSMVYAYLGKDYDDKDLEGKIKVPFVIRDKTTNESVTFKFTVLKDMLRAETYCKNYFKDEFIKYADIRSSLNKIHSINNEEKQDEMLDDYLDKNEDKVAEYFEFIMEYGKMVAKIIQAQTIVEYNGKKLESLNEQWEIYSNNVSYDIWKKYNDVVNKYPFGIKDDIDVYIPSLKKKVHRRVGFQFDDFIHVDRHEDSDRCVVEFD